MTEVMRIKNVVGESIGIVTVNSLLHQPAPSMRAASYNASGIPWIPAPYINDAYPTCIHMDMNIIDGIAHVLSARKAGGLPMPRLLSMLVIGPYLLYKSDQINETATMFDI